MPSVGTDSPGNEPFAAFVWARKNPWLALVLGFFFSGISLGIYFRSWIDLIVPTVI